MRDCRSKGRRGKLLPPEDQNDQHEQTHFAYWNIDGFELNSGWAVANVLASKVFQCLGLIISKLYPDYF